MKKTLRDLRRWAGYNQTYVANELSVDQTTVSKWENGESLPRVDKLIELAKFYNVKLDDIDLSKKTK